MFEHQYQKEHEFAIESEKDLVEVFRLRDQKKLILPDNLEYPFSVKSYMTWRESSGVYTYLVFKLPNWDLPRGVAFKRTVAEYPGGLCCWCNSYGTSEEISFMSVSMSGNVSSGYLLCQDLSCLEKIEELSARAGKDPAPNIETLFFRMGKLFENISGYRVE